MPDAEEDSAKPTYDEIELLKYENSRRKREEARFSEGSHWMSLVRDSSIEKTPRSTRSMPVDVKSMKGMPGLIIAGMAKAGTSALFNYLHQSAGYCSSDCSERSDADPLGCDNGINGKETNYFTSKYPGMKGDFELSEDPAIKSLYAHCHGSLGIEASPGNFDVAPRVAFSYLPREGMEVAIRNLRIIITLRNPADRHLSWFNHMVADLDKKNKSYYNSNKFLRKSKGGYVSFDTYVHKVVIPKLRGERKGQRGVPARNASP